MPCCMSAACPDASSSTGSPLLRTASPQVEARLRDSQSSEAMLRQQLLTLRDRKMGGSGGAGCFACLGGS